jgi:hypothetical protein
MNRFLSLGLAVLAFLLPACGGTPEPEPTQAPVVAPIPIPPPPPPFVDVLPEFKKSARAFLDLAKKLDQSANATPPPPYQELWKDYEPLEEIYNKVINNEPKSGPGANAFGCINNIRDSLHKTKLTLKNAEDVKTKLDAETLNRKTFFDQAEFFWKQTPEFTKREE